VTVEITKPNDEGITSDYVQEVNHNFSSINEITSDMRLTVFNQLTPIASMTTYTSATIMVITTPRPATKISDGTDCYEYIRELYDGFF
jgi:hypothetical protein